MKNNDYDIKSIRASFNGVDYRSKLEAEWAVFFTWLGLKFEYEPRKFGLSNGGLITGNTYTPDFIVKRNGFDDDFIYEIKPKGFGRDDRVEELNNIFESMQLRYSTWNIFYVQVLRGSPHDHFKHYINDRYEDGTMYVCPCCASIGYVDRPEEVGHIYCGLCDISTQSTRSGQLLPGLQNKYLIDYHKGFLNFLDSQIFAHKWYVRTVFEAVHASLEWRYANSAKESVLKLQLEK